MLGKKIQGYSRVGAGVGGELNLFSTVGHEWPGGVCRPLDPHPSPRPILEIEPEVSHTHMTCWLSGKLPSGHCGTRKITMAGTTGVYSMGNAASRPPRNPLLYLVHPRTLVDAYIYRPHQDRVLSQANKLMIIDKVN